MTETARLRLPEIAASQAQKHVTHNEALTMLDTLVQASVIDKDLTAPPGAPAEGDCYIVAGGGGSATGAWTSWEKRLARFEDGEWVSFLPGAGWHVWAVDEAALYFYNGTSWTPVSGVTGSYRGICDGRLTVESGVAVSTTGQTARTVLYFTPYGGNQIGLYDGVSAWALVDFAEVSIKLTDTQTGSTANGSTAVTGLSDTSQLIVGMEVSGTGIAGDTTIAAIASGTAITLSANATATGSASLTFKLPANRNADVFGFSNAGALKLEFGPLWTNDSTRAAALALQSGVHVKSGAPARRYLGTIRTTASGQTEFSFGGKAAGGQEAKLYLWNLYNPVAWTAFVADSTDSWSYATSSWRPAGNSTAMRISFVAGLAGLRIAARYGALVNAGVTTPCAFALGVDSTSVYGGRAGKVWHENSIRAVMAEHGFAAAAGYHYVQALELGAPGATFCGDAGDNTVQPTGLHAIGYY